MVSSYQQEISTLLDQMEPVLPMDNSNNSQHRSSSKKWLSVAVSAVLAVALLAAAAATRFHNNGNNVIGAESNEMAGLVEHGTAKSIVNFPIELEGKHKHKSHNDDDDDDSLTECEDGSYSKRTLKLAAEVPFASLFRDTKGQKKFEASSVIVQDGFAYAVCDSSWAVSKFGIELQPFGSANMQVGDPYRQEDESGYEALLFEDGLFYVIRESIQHEDETYHAIVEALALGTDNYEAVEICSAEFEFEGDSKGFEGAIAVRDPNNTMVILGLCEGNKCSEEHKHDLGHGRIVAMQKAVVNGTCVWETLRTIHIPKSAYFMDYSAITMTESGRVAITSQENSQLWVGQLLGKTDVGTWNITAMEFDEDVGTIYDFPKNHECETVYCNVEGAYWINDDMIMAVSDKMKSKGKQDFRCFEKDQSVHVFILP